MAELPGKLTLETNDTAAHAAAPPAGRQRGLESEWWQIPNFGYLLLWWVALIGIYAVFSSIPDREHYRPVDLEMISDGWYAVLACGVIGAFYAKRARLVWFVISIALSFAILLLTLIGLGAFRSLMNL